LKNITEKFLWVFAFFLVAVAYLFGLFVDLTGDSGLYAAISRQMVESGDWFNLKINGMPYDQKPHLFFWLAGLGIKFFGNTNFAFKLFPFLYGAAGVYFTYRLGRQIYSEETGMLAALILGTSQIFFLYFFDFHTDSVLQTGVVLALWQLAAYLQSQKPINFVLGFFGVGLAMLSKGPIGAVLPFLAVFFYLLAERDFKQLFHPKWILGILIVLAVISPSLIHLYKNFGFEGIKFFFITNNVGRITGSYAGSSTDYFYAIHTILWAFLPWTIFVAAALFSTVKDWFLRKPNLKWSYYLMGGVFILLLILTVAKGKAPNYFLIAVAPISVVAASWLTRLATFSVKFQRRVLCTQIIFVGILLVFFSVLVYIFREDGIWGSALFTILFIIIFPRIKWLRKPLLVNSLLLSVLVLGGINLFLNAHVLPKLFAYQGARQVLKLYDENSSSESKLYNLSIEEYALFFYAGQRVENIEKWDELRLALSKPGAWIYANEIDYKEILFQKLPIDTVYFIEQRGMNRVNLTFLNPKTRETALKTNYLIVSKRK
jgi:4-amino-4-deoxy-L-arabinose transferase-like glycosyltransferase